MCKYLTSPDVPEAAIFERPVSCARERNDRRSWSVRRNDAFQTCLLHNAATPFDNDTRRDAQRLRLHRDISLLPPPSSLNHNTATTGAAAYFPSAAGCTSSSGGGGSRNPLKGFKILHATNPLRSRNHVWVERILGQREGAGPRCRAGGPLLEL